MQPQKTILTDCDGVLLDWGDSFYEYMAVMGHYREPNTDHFYRLSMQFPEFTDADMMAIVEEFNTSDYVRKLRPWADAVQGVRTLKELGYRFICITAISETPAARDCREENLHNVFGADVFHHDEMVCLKPGASKRDALLPFQGSGMFWLEDHFSHAETGFELGLNTILMSNPHNKHFHTDLFPRVDTWSEIVPLVVAAEHPIKLGIPIDI